MTAARLPLTPSLTDNGDRTFTVGFAKGAPFKVSVPITVTGGTTLESSVTVEAGALASSPVTVTWNEGNTGTVTVTPGQPVWVDVSGVTRDFNGIALGTGEALPLAAN